MCHLERERHIWWIVEVVDSSSSIAASIYKPAMFFVSANQYNKPFNLDKPIVSEWIDRFSFPLCHYMIFMARVYLFQGLLEQVNVILGDCKFITKLYNMVVWVKISKHFPTNIVVPVLYAFAIFCLYWFLNNIVNLIAVSTKMLKRARTYVHCTSFLVLTQITMLWSMLTNTV